MEVMTMRRRSGFTIVELLVAMALIMFIMAIISDAFVAAMKSFRDLKASADLAERLRSVSTVMRRDLAADHFDGKRRMSGADFWTGGPPPEGFFRLYQGSPPVTPTAANPNPAYAFEGSDPNELGVAQNLRLRSSYRATDHMLHFAVKLRGNERGDYFSAAVPPTSALVTSPFLLGSLHYQDATEDTNTKRLFNSQLAEVAYFLRATGDNAKGTPLFALYRRQRLLLRDSGLITDPTGTIPRAIAGTVDQYPEMSCTASGANLYFNNPRDLTMPARRLGMAGLAGTLTATDPNNNNAPSYPTLFDTTNNDDYRGADLVLSDVISFEVRLLLGDGNRFESLYDITGAPGGYRSGANPPIPPFLPNNPSFSDRNNGPLVFDTWSNAVDVAGGPGLGGVFDYSGWNTATNTTGSRIPIYQRVTNNPNGTTSTTTIHVRAVMVTIRVWDVKTEQTRQITIVQDL
jgi:type II secretory pathway pseudopilin PulG